MRNVLDLSHVAAAVLYSLIGTAVFAAAFVLIDKLTPYDLWRELVEKQNRALASLLSGFAVALGLIIAASIVG